MSFCVSINDLSKKDIINITSQLKFKSKKDEYKEQEIYKVYSIDKINKTIQIPIGLWKDIYTSFPNDIECEYKEISSFSHPVKPLTISTDPSKRNRDQDNVISQSLSILKKDNSILMNMYCGFGKTFTSIYLAIELKLKVLVLCHSDTLKRQWVEAFKQFSNLKVCIITGDISIKKLEKYDAYIIGVQKCSTTDESIFKELQIGTIIIDECHLITINAFTKGLLKLTPRYLIGLSATPDRKDGLHSLFKPYFNKNIITRFEKKKFEVIKYTTPYKPIIEYKMLFGRLRVDAHMKRNSIESNENRWNFIKEIVLSNIKNNNIIILCERVIQIEGLYNILYKESGDNVDTFYGTKKNYNKDAKVLIAGIKKAGVGFDNPKLTMMILASYTDDVRQLEGRIRTTDNTIYHLVDNHPSFEGKWNKCEKWYKKRGATIVYKGFKINKGDNQELPRFSY